MTDAKKPKLKIILASQEQLSSVSLEDKITLAKKLQEIHKQWWAEKHSLEVINKTDKEKKPMIYLMNELRDYLLNIVQQIYSLSIKCVLLRIGTGCNCL